MPEHPAITFRPLEATDLPMLHRWLHNPAVVRWWHRAPTYREVATKYSPRIAGTVPVYPFIVSADSTPFGYLQWYRLAENPGHPAESFAEPGAAAVDLLIGEDAYRGRGLGAAMLRNFVRAVVFADHAITACFIDPHPENIVAIRSYRRAGFRDIGSSAVGTDGDVAWLLRYERVEARQAGT